MNLLVTGATGFIGGAVVRLARERGHRVGALVRPETWRERGLRDEDDLTWLPGTMAEPPDASRLREFAPDACVHAAWIATPGVYLDSPENALWVDWSRGFLRRAREAGAGYVLGLGTCIEYAVDPVARIPLREDATPLDPVSPYARAKHALHQALAEESRAEGFTLGWGRVFYPYGPGEHPARLCSALIRQLARGERLELKTPDSTKDYIYVDDLAGAILRLVERRVPGAVNLGTGEGVTVRTLAETLARRMGCPPGLVGVAASSPAPDPLAYVVADAGRLWALGWRAEVVFEEGVARLIERWTAHCVRG